jgi:hypothetical protein
MPPSSSDPEASTPPRDWAELGEEEQTRLQIAYGRYLDSLPPTCSLETKIERFRRWLADRGIEYRG